MHTATGEIFADVFVCKVWCARSRSCSAADRSPAQTDICAIVLGILGTTLYGFVPNTKRALNAAAYASSAAHHRALVSQTWRVCGDAIDARGQGALTHLAFHGRILSAEPPRLEDEGAVEEDVGLCYRTMPMAPGNGLPYCGCGA